MTPEESSFVNDLRIRSHKGSENPPTLEEMKRFILILAADRKMVRSESKPKAKAVAQASVSSALSALKALGASKST